MKIIFNWSYKNIFLLTYNIICPDSNFTFFFIQFKKVISIYCQRHTLFYIFHRMQKWKIEKDKRRYSTFSFSFFFFFLFHIARTKKSFTFHESIFNIHHRNKSTSFSSLTRKTMKINLIKQKYNSILFNFY